MYIVILPEAVCYARYRVSCSAGNCEGGEQKWESFDSVFMRTRLYVITRHIRSPTANSRIRQISRSSDNVHDHVSIRGGWHVDRKFLPQRQSLRSFLAEQMKGHKMRRSLEFRFPRTRLCIITRHIRRYTQESGTLYRDLQSFRGHGSIRGETHARRTFLLRTRRLRCFPPVKMTRTQMKESFEFDIHAPDSILSNTTCRPFAPKWSLSLGIHRLHVTGNRGKLLMPLCMFGGDRELVPTILAEKCLPEYQF